MNAVGIGSLTLFDNWRLDQWVVVVVVVALSGAVMALVLALVVLAVQASAVQALLEHQEQEKQPGKQGHANVNCRRTADQRVNVRNQVHRRSPVTRATRIGVTTPKVATSSRRQMLGIKWCREAMAGLVEQQVVHAVPSRPKPNTST